MAIYDIPVNSLEGEKFDLGALRGKTVLVVNVASRCGLTPQYEGLEKLHEELADKGFSVLGVPCNQFMGQEPGTAEQIREFCSTRYGVTFPILEKADVNGENRHALYHMLTEREDASGNAGDIQWNFEKFLVSPQGDVIGRFRPRTTPDNPDLRAAIEAALPQATLRQVQQERAETV